MMLEVEGKTPLLASPANSEVDERDVFAMYARAAGNPPYDACSKRASVFR